MGGLIPFDSTFPLGISSVNNKPFFLQLTLAITYLWQWSIKSDHKGLYPALYMHITALLNSCQQRRNDQVLYDFFRLRGQASSQSCFLPALWPSDRLQTDRFSCAFYLASLFRIFFNNRLGKRWTFAEWLRHCVCCIVQSNSPPNWKAASLLYLVF